MERNRLTFLVITDPSQPARSLEVPRRLVKGVVGGVAAVVLFLAAGTATVVLRLSDLAKVDGLQAQNELLVADLQRMEEMVGQLSESMAAISERDRRFRLLAGLSELDPEVRQVGIGGPGSSSVAEEPLLDLDIQVGSQTFGVNSDLNRLLRQSNLLKVSLGEASKAMESHHEKLAGYPSIDPTKGWLSSSFSQSRWHPLLNIRRPHEGIDISAPRGTPVVATADGVVTYAGFRPGFGWTVEIDHGNGIKTRYAHGQKNLKARVGDKVRRGDVIAFVGASGLAKGPHVHYEVLDNGRAVNPENYRLHQVIVE